ncbi:MAG: hypothetical protein ACK5MU_01090 [Candidatus Saccharimonadales bacterium]
MLKYAWAVLVAYAKLYNLKTNVRATDHLRRIDQGLPVQFRHVQSVLEHEAMTAKLVELICWVYGDRLKAAGEKIDPMRSSFMASRHDDVEWRDGDMVPQLGYMNFTPEMKVIAERGALEDLLGVEQNFLRDAHEEYEKRETGDAILAKTGDILELFCHNRVLLCFGLGKITYGNYKECAPETHDESLEFLEKSPIGETSIAEVLEARYIKRFREMNFPTIYQDIFDEIVVALRSFPFAEYISVDR